MSAAGRANLSPSPLRIPEFRNLMGVSITVALGFGLVAPVLPTYARSFGVSLAAVGLVYLVFGLTRFSFGLVGGLVVDRFGDRASTMAGLLIVAASSYAAGFAGSFPELVFARGFGGTGSALFIAGLQNRIIRIVEPKAMGRATGVFASSFLVGIGLGPIVGGLIQARFGASSVFHIYATGLLVATVVAWVVMAGEHVEKEAVRRNPLDALRAARPLFKDRLYIAALGSTFISWWILSGPAQAVGIVFAEDELGLTSFQRGLALTMVAVGEVMALFIAGRASDRFGRRAVMIPSLLLLTAATVAMGQIGASLSWAFFPLMVAVGIGVAGNRTAGGGLLADAVPREGSGAAIGVNQMAGDLGFLLAPTAIGAIAEGPGFPIAYGLAALPAGALILYGLGLPGGPPAEKKGPPEGAIAEPAEPIG